MLASLFHSHMEMRSSVGADEPLDLVQEAMVEGVARLLEGSGEIVEMEHVAGLRRRLAVDDDAGAKRMAVNTRVRMPWRCAGQIMGGLETEVLVNAHGAHIGDFARLRHPCGGRPEAGSAEGDGAPALPPPVPAV